MSNNSFGRNVPNFYLIKSSATHSRVIFHRLHARSHSNTWNKTNLFLSNSISNAFSFSFPFDHISPNRVCLNGSREIWEDETKKQNFQCFFLLFCCRLWSGFPHKWDAYELFYEFFNVFFTLFFFSFFLMNWWFPHISLKSVECRENKRERTREIKKMMYDI